MASQLPYILFHLLKQLGFGGFSLVPLTLVNTAPDLRPGSSRLSSPGSVPLSSGLSFSVTPSLWPLLHSPRDDGNFTVPPDFPGLYAK